MIDHSVQVDAFGTRDSFRFNAEREFERNQERYAFLRWGKDAFDNFAVVPPDTGIVHQVNLEYLARVVFTSDETAHEGALQAYPDTLVGTDSHTTMINGLGVLGWGVGGIEAEAVMLGQAMSMLMPQVLGFKLSGELPEGATATDLVLTVTQMLRERGVVGMFVEFFGPGSRRCRSPTGRRSATCRPSSARPARSSRSTPRRCATSSSPAARRSASSSSRPTPRSRACGTRRTPRSRPTPTRSSSTFRGRALARRPEAPAGPRLADRVEGRLPARARGHAARRRRGPEEGEPDPDEESADSFPSSDPPSSGDHNGHSERSPQPHNDGGTGGLQVAERSRSASPVTLEDGTETELDHGHVVIAAITSCTNTSNPTVMLGAGMLARNAVAKGLKSKPWVKTSLAPGSKVVTEYLERAGLTEDLEALGFHLVGYGCTTCIGNSGPLPEEIADIVNAEDLAVVSVLSGNRNFEGRINPDVKMNYLASPPLCVAYAIAGTMDIDLLDEPLGQDQDGNDVFLKDIWPDEQEVAETVESAVQSDMFRKSYDEVYDGDERWNSLDVPEVTSEALWRTRGGHNSRSAARFGRKPSRCSDSRTRAARSASTDRSRDRMSQIFFWARRIPRRSRSATPTSCCEAGRSTRISPTTGASTRR